MHKMNSLCGYSWIFTNTHPRTINFILQSSPHENNFVLVEHWIWYIKHKVIWKEKRDIWTKIHLKHSNIKIRFQKCHNNKFFVISSIIKSQVDYTRCNQPTTNIPIASRLVETGIIPDCEIAPWDALNPITPQKPAGNRTPPTVSIPATFVDDNQ